MRPNAKKMHNSGSDPIYNNHNGTPHLGCQHFEIPNVMQATYFGSLFGIYLAFRNVNEMQCKYIYSGGYAKCKCNANEM